MTLKAPFRQSPFPRSGESGFTLIELSIVLVIIGLIIGGVLVGQDLIAAAYTRAQITQIEKYNTAVNTFKVKYGYIPGDIPDPYASQFGFVARGQYAGEGDGNGVIEGISANAASSNSGFYQAGGETPVFWEDLSTANMIDGTFNRASATSPASAISLTTGPNLYSYFPVGKIAQGNFIYVYSNNGLNYFGLSAISYADATSMNSTPALTVQQAYNMDKKVDDGLPQSGKITAVYENHNLPPPFPDWANGNGWTGASPGTAASSAITTCFDNGGSAAATMQYSMEVSNGSGPNCALSFQMQGAAR